MESPTDLEQSILKTVCWFSVFQYPVTSFEIWKWLLEPAQAYGLEEVLQNLETGAWLKTRVRAHQGYYHAELGESFIEQVTMRQTRYLDAVKKFKKLRRASRYFHVLGSVKGVAAVNSMAFWNTTETSDMDLFVVTKKRSIWSTRFWMVAPFILFGDRPHANQEVEDPFCFSFFADETALAMKPLALDEQDYYFAFWLKSLVPILDRHQTFRALAEQNRWVERLLPNTTPRSGHRLHQSSRLPRLVHSTRILEPLHRHLQQMSFPEPIRSMANKDSRVVISDHLLKFHDQDRRAEFREEFKRRVAKLM